MKLIYGLSLLVSLGVAIVPSGGDSTTPEIPFSCLGAFSTCLYNSGNLTSAAQRACKNALDGCGRCAKQEAQCWAGTRDTGASDFRFGCTSQTLSCYHGVENPNTISGQYYTFSDAISSCNAQPFVNHAVCASIMSGLNDCVTQEKNCRNGTLPGRVCDGNASECWNGAVGVGEANSAPPPPDCTTTAA